MSTAEQKPMLAVLETDLHFMQTVRNDPEANEASYFSHAAVAELIEADKEYDAANDRLNKSADCDDAFRWRLYEQFVAAIERRRAALARLGGAT